MRKRAEMEEKQKKNKKPMTIEFTFNNFLRSSRRKRYELDRQDKIDREEAEETQRRLKYDERRRRRLKRREEKRKKKIAEIKNPISNIVK